MPDLHPPLPDPAAPVRAGDDIGLLKSGQRSADRERQHPGPDGTRRGAAQSLSELVALNCRDLYRLGIPGFKPHNPYRQRTGVPGCECVEPVPTLREYGVSFARAEDEEQSCRVPHRLAFGEVLVDICCSCGADFPGGWCDLEAAIREALA